MSFKERFDSSEQRELPTCFYGPPWCGKCTPETCFYHMKFAFMDDENDA